VWGAVDL